MRLATMRHLAVILTLCLCFGCVSNNPDQISPFSNHASNLAGHEDIIEAVFRHMCQPEPVEKEVSHQVNLVHKVYFLGLDDSQDPGPELLQRLSDLPSPVKPLSAGEWKDFFIYDKATRERGAAFYVRSITMHSRNYCDVQAVIHPGGGLSASGPIYRVKRKHGKWTVIGEGLAWIS